MPDYNFDSLSPYDFENLCRDLLQHALGIRLQSFSTGRDDGIDLRFAVSDERSLVVQCKHYARSSLSSLMSHLRRSEAPKVKRLAPNRYVFATSLGLTPANHDAIARVFSPYCRSAQDVYGREDLNNLLSLHPDVERNHFKLWLTSTPVLQRVLRNASYVQSAFDRDEIENHLRVYVQVPSVGQAQQILENTHACIISGIPGIGKTTLAHILLVQYLVDGWEIVTIRQNVTEALERYDLARSKKQVFWYDDFLGQVALAEKLAKNEDRALVQLIKSISDHPHRRFILTTREYILKQAQDHYELLSRADLELHKHMLTLGDYSDLDRARILANHLYFNGVPADHIRELLLDRKYRQIVRHRNYSPRVVQWLTTANRTSQCAPSQYVSLFLDTLENPTRLWEHAFQEQLSQQARQLVVELASFGQMVLLEDLQRAFDSLCSLRVGKYGVAWSSADFSRAIRELEGTFVSVRKYASTTAVGFHNPSIRDYIEHYLGENPQDLMDTVEAALFFDQVNRATLLLLGRATPTEGSGLVGDEGQGIARALERTLDAPGCQIVQVRRWPRGYDVVRADQAKSGRLCSSLLLAETVGEARPYVLAQVDAFADCVDGLSPDRADLVTLIEQGREADWIAEERVHMWLQGMKGYLLETPDTWSEVEALASWRREWPSELSEEEGEALEESMGEAIEREVSYYMEEEPDAEEVQAFAGNLISVTESMGWDHAGNISALEERAEELRPPEPDYDHEEWHGGRPIGGGATDDIDSVFDSLKQ